MKITSIKGLTAAALLLTSTGVFAQDGRYGNSPGGERREVAYAPGQREIPLDRVRADLDQMSRNLFYLSRTDRARFDRVRVEIAQFQAKWQRGRFDWRELDDVTRALRAVVAQNRLRPPDRDLLERDLVRLREFRARGEGYGAYRNGPGNGFRR